MISSSATHTRHCCLLRKWPVAHHEVLGALVLILKRLSLDLQAVFFPSVVRLPREDLLPLSTIVH